MRENNRPVPKYWVTPPPKKTTKNKKQKTLQIKRKQYNNILNKDQKGLKVLELQKQTKIKKNALNPDGVIYVWLYGSNFERSINPFFSSPVTSKIVG